MYTFYPFSLLISMTCEVDPWLKGLHWAKVNVTDLKMKMRTLTADR